MADWKLRLYHHLPPFLRDAAATMRGYQLRSWRYGPETEQLVAEALERDHWSPEQWRTYQENRLDFVLHRAATQVPYYRGQWSERRRKGDRASWDYLENWPILEKEQLRAQSTSFVAEDCDPRNMFHEHTSGTTGKPLDLWWSRNAVRQWYALFEARWRRWYGVTRHHRWAILGGQLIVPIQTTAPPFWAWNRAANQLYMSSYHLSSAFIPHYLDALHAYEIHYLWGYTSSLYELAVESIRLGRRDVKMAVAITNAEPVFDYQRNTIEEAFQCAVYETYGMSEAVSAASECERRRLHLWPEAGFSEVEKHTSELICTGFVNTDMPLIRYRVGDRGVMTSEDNSCPCGRTLPLLQSIDGRRDDVIYTSDGRRIGRLDPVFKSELPIKEAQIIQTSLTDFVVRYVPDVHYSTADGKQLTHRIRERIGDVSVQLEAVDKIPRGPNGKFRAVICNLSPEEHARVAK